MGRLWLEQMRALPTAQVCLALWSLMLKGLRLILPIPPHRVKLRGWEVVVLLVSVQCWACHLTSLGLSLLTIKV